MCVRVFKRLNFTSKPSLGQWKVLYLPQENLNVQKFNHVQGERNGRMLIIVYRRVENLKLFNNVSQGLVEILNERFKETCTFLSKRGEGIYL